MVCCRVNIFHARDARTIEWSVWLSKGCFEPRPVLMNHDVKLKHQACNAASATVNDGFAILIKAESTKI